MPIAPARVLAFDILQLVEGGGYASDLLHSRAAAMDARDAGLAHEIVFGVLRCRAQLDYLIAHYSARTGKLDPEVRTALRMGIYQLRYLERIPAHAAVADTVQLVKRARKTSAAGFVNAILRQVDRNPVAWPDRATELSMPAWLLERRNTRGSRRRASAGRTSGRRRSYRSSICDPGSAFWTFARRPVTRRRRRSRPRFGRSPAMSTSTGWCR
jgi:16S rRNA (cytosine967-C5)-methyltransferase